MKRITLYTIISASIIITLLITWQEWFSTVRDRENVVVTFILTSLELVGIFLAIFLLSRYIQYRRPRRFVLEGFSNASDLAASEQKPIDLNNLAREELTLQFQFIYRILEEHAKSWLTGNNHQSPSPAQDSDSICRFSDRVPYTALFTETDPSSEEATEKVCIEWYLPTIGQREHNLPGDMYASSMKQLEQTMRSFDDQSNVAGMANVVGGTTPREIGLLLNAIDALVPPRIIKAIGHLQHTADPFDRVGITFEVIDLSSPQSTVIRTIWQPDKTPLSQKSLAARYIALLRPAMRWLVLVFWEQKLFARIKLAHFNGGLQARNQNYARILYLLGSLYSFSAGQFPAFSEFFNQSAVDHFERASKSDPQWCLPFNYLANVCQSAMRKSQNDLHNKLLDEALELHRIGIELAKKYEEKDIQGRFQACQAITKLVSGDQRLIDEAKQEIQGVVENANPTEFDTTPEVSALYLCNLAYWYALADKKNIGVANARQLARRYLTYSVARSPHTIWHGVRNDEDLDSIQNEASLNALKNELDARQKQKPFLSRLPGEEFEAEMNAILSKVGW